MPLAEILNHVQLTPRIGTSGQPTPEQLKEIAAAGYQAVINLALPTSDNALADEAGHVTRLRMAYFQIPVLFEAPRADEARTFVGVMRALEDRPVWVHCAMNLRVSAFMYVYLRHDLGLPEAEARSPMLAKWEPRMDEMWRKVLALTPEELALPKRR